MGIRAVRVDIGNSFRMVPPHSGQMRGSIRMVYDVDPLCCPSCGGQMRIISFIEEPSIIDSIIAHLKLTFEAERPPPPHNVQQELLMAAEALRNTRHR